MPKVIIHSGSYRKMPVVAAEFELVKDYVAGTNGGHVTVKSDGFFGPDFDVVRIKVNSRDDFEVVGTFTNKTAIVEETDEEIMARIESRFAILDDMTKAAIQNEIRAMIVQGPPGVGKSYGVEYQLERAGMFDQISGRKPRYEVVKGAMTPIGLYQVLYKYSDKNNVLVFDDCDSILFDDLSLNVLKAALDSGKKRRIHWNADSSLLRREGIPSAFDFHGSIIFITNLKFDNIKSKKLQDHLEALQSRCHFLDLTLNTTRDKILRVKQIFRKGDLFQDYDFTPEVGDEIVRFMMDNHAQLREISLRMALKLADLTKVSDNWKELAKSTCMKHA